MKNQTSLEVRVLKCLEKVRAVNADVNKDALFKQDLGYESIDLVDLLFTLEEEFARPFQLREFNVFVLKNSKFASWDFTFGQLCRFVSENVGV